MCVADVIVDGAPSDVDPLLPDATPVPDGIFADAFVFPTTPASCKAIEAQMPSIPSGVFVLDPDGDGGQPPFDAYCDLDADGGGWTLVLKLDGSQQTFVYGSALWTNSNTLNPGSPGFDTTEAKLQSFNSIAFTQLRLGMTESGTTRWLTVDLGANSLQELMNAGASMTSLGRSTWGSLLSSSSLQMMCPEEGTNTDKVRIGIQGNELQVCNGHDSWIGFGGAALGACTGSSTVGNLACNNADNGDRDTATFGYVMVR